MGTLAVFIGLTVLWVISVGYHVDMLQKRRSIKGIISIAYSFATFLYIVYTLYPF